jgi:formyltetrahydrofolate deformylase
MVLVPSAVRRTGHITSRLAFGRFSSQLSSFSTTSRVQAKTRSFCSSPTFATKKQQQQIQQQKSLAKMPADDHILTLSCPDKPGIVHAVTGVFARNELNILDLQQFSDADSKRFFMRVHFASTTSAGPENGTGGGLSSQFDELATQLKMDYDLRPVSQKPKVLIMVSKIGHCLNDLLFRQKTGQLAIDVPVIVSNHREFESLAKSYDVEFQHLPVTKDTKAEQEGRILELVRRHDVDLIVLARYMQVLSPTLCEAMSGKIINIHHSFLPSFKGAKPYHQAYDRGVKIIGATAHFVTADLDEGPIIEQRVARVDHSMTPKELVDEGSNVESQVLAAAVKWWSEKRVFLNGHKTVVFS